MVYTFCFLEIQEKTRNTEKNKTNKMATQRIKVGITRHNCAFLRVGS